jgi:hypothetical protein
VVPFKYDYGLEKIAQNVAQTILVKNDRYTDFIGEKCCLQIGATSVNFEKN